MLAVERELLDRAVDRGVARRPHDIGVERRRRKARALLVAFELGHVDAVGRKPAHRLVQRGGDVLHLEHERGHRGDPGKRRRCERLLRQRHEPGHVVGGILDILGDDLEPVKLRRDRRGDGAIARIALFLDERRGACGIGVGHRHDPARAQILPGLAQRLRMAIGGGERTIAQPHDCVADRQEVLAGDRQAAFGEQEMDIRHPPVLRVLDRDQSARSAAILDRVERVFEAEARQRQRFGIVFERRAVAVAPRRALERDRPGRIAGSSADQLGDQFARRGGIAVHAQRPEIRGSMAPALRHAGQIPQWPLRQSPRSPCAGTDA